MDKKILAALQSVRPESKFEESLDFQNDGLLDSFDMIVLVTALERGFSIKIPGEMIVPSNFSNIEAIDNLIAKLMAN